MADIKNRLSRNAPGDFFVDRTCDNCDVCRQIAPATFGTESSPRAVVHVQPETDDDKRRAMWAILSCPNGSIGTTARAGLAEVMNDFPLPIEDDVYFCGFNTLKSAGGNAYFVHHPGGNWLINTPKYQAQLVRRFHELGGVRYIFISHRDDVGENDKFAHEFGSERIIHAADLEAQPAAEHIIEGNEPYRFSSDFLIVPAPGHTEGHCMLIYKSKFLFSGDALMFDRHKQRIDLWDAYWTWYSFRTQAESIARLAEHTFQWLLPTHGQRVKLSPEEMKLQIAQAAQRALNISDPNPQDEKRAKILRYYSDELSKLNQPVYAALMRARAERMEHDLVPVVE